MTTARTCLVTGATGQDGSYLVEHLLAQGHEVVALTRPGDPADLDPQITRVDVDLADADAAAAMVHEIAPGQMYLLGGISSVAYSFEHPVETAQITGVSALAMVEAARELSEQGADVRLVHAASSEIFGQPTRWPQTESTPIAPTSPYGVAKAMGHLAVGAARARGLHASSLVLYNHESPRRPTGFVTRKITSTVAAISLGQADELVLGNLEAQRDWGWAPDYVTAMMLAADAARPGDYVVASGISHTVADFVSIAFACVGISDWERYVRSDAEFFRPVDAYEMVGDATKIRTELGWAPTRDLAGVIAEMVDHDLALVRAGGSS